MKIIPFETSHVEMAQRLAYAAYLREFEAVPCLPHMPNTPPLESFAAYKMGVAAFENNDLVGFLCAYPAFDNAFGSTGVRGVYIPPHTHCVRLDHPRRAQVYTRLYTAAARLWVNAKAASHAITVYAHDDEAIGAFIRNGFGIRLADAARPANGNYAESPTGDNIQTHKMTNEYTFHALQISETASLYPLWKALVEHLQEAPIFLAYHAALTEEAFAARDERPGARYFAAKYEGKYVAYVRLADDGENFISETPAMINICGAYCEPAHRGTGIFRDLLAYIGEIVSNEGYTCLGVDYESFNPTARGFWEKYFIPYTFSVTRRIDEYALDI